MMKKLAILAIAFIFAFSLTGLAFAQEKAKAEKPAEVAKPADVAKPAAAAKPEAKPEAAKKEAPKPVVKYRLGGYVVKVDEAAKKIVLQQDNVKKHKKVTLNVSKNAAKDLAEVRVGDGVNVWVTGNTVTTLTKVF